MSETSGGPGDATGTGQGTGVTKPNKLAAGGSDETEQLVFTLRVATGELVKVEEVSHAGERSEVPMAEAVELAGQKSVENVEAALDDALEAGIISVLDPESDIDESDGNGSGEDVQLRRELLTLIIGGEVRQRLLHRLASRLVVASMFDASKSE